MTSHHFPMSSAPISARPLRRAFPRPSRPARPDDLTDSSPCSAGFPACEPAFHPHPRATARPPHPVAAQSPNSTAPGQSARPFSLLFISPGSPLSILAIPSSNRKIAPHEAPSKVTHTPPNPKIGLSRSSASSHSSRLTDSPKTVRGIPSITCAGFHIPFHQIAPKSPAISHLSPISHRTISHSIHRAILSRITVRGTFHRAPDIHPHLRQPAHPFRPLAHCRDISADHETPCRLSVHLWTMDTSCAIFHIPLHQIAPKSAAISHLSPISHPKISPSIQRAILSSVTGRGTFHRAPNIHPHLRQSASPIRPLACRDISADHETSRRLSVQLKNLGIFSNS